jgi:hypothetical protein
VACGSAANVSTLGVGTHCGSIDWTAASRYQIVFPIYRIPFSNAPYQKLGEAFRSGCIAGSGGLSRGFDANAGNYIPWGVAYPANRLPTEIEIFTDASCVNLATAIRFPRGISNPPVNAVANPVRDTSSLRIYVRQP